MEHFGDLGMQDVETSLTMVDIINLDRFRKSRRQKQPATMAAQNRLRHSRDKASRRRSTDEQDAARHLFDGKRMNRYDPVPDQPA